MARNDQVIVKPLPNEEEMSHGGIIMPNTMHTMPLATVVDVGPGGITSGGERIAINLRKGDVVGMRPGSGHMFVLGGAQYATLSETDVCFVVTENKPDGVITQ